MIRFENVTKRHGSVVALDETSFTVERGEHVAVVGASGSGKTTLLSLIGGLLRPSSGAIHVLDRAITDLGASELARLRAEHIGFVFQTFHLIPYLDVLNNVRAALTATDERARALLSELGLEDRLEHRPGQLSVGERQRVGLARALVSEPDLILADEPTGNLDPDSESEVCRILEDYHSRGGTVMVVTHSEPVAERAGRCIRLEAGRCVEGA